MGYLKVLLLAVWVVLVPIHAALITVMALPVVDLVLALIVAYRTKQPITSAGLKRTVGKILMYELATVLAFCTEHYLLDALIPAVKMVTGLIGVTELKSCLEHLDDLNGSSFFESVLARLAPPQPPPKDPPPAA